MKTRRTMHKNGFLDCRGLPGFDDREYPPAGAPPVPQYFFDDEAFVDTPPTFLQSIDWKQVRFWSLMFVGVVTSQVVVSLAVEAAR